MPLSVRSYWILIYAVFGPHMLTNNQIMYAPLFGNDFILENIFFTILQGSIYKWKINTSVMCC